MAETAKTNFDEFKGKDYVFVADWLKTKGLHKLCSVFEGGKERFISTVQVRDKRPTHTQNARTIFAQTRVKKRVPKHAFVHICAHLIRMFPFVIHSHNCPLCCILLHNKRARQKAVPTKNTAEKYLCRETNSRFARCWCTVANH